MALFERPLETITELDLRALIEGEAREDYHIEYKRSISLKDKQDKIDFLGGLSSFANSSGGDFIVGVSCKEGIPIELPDGKLISIRRSSASKISCVTPWSHVSPRRSRKCRSPAVLGL